MAPSSQDGLDRILEELVKDAQLLIDRPYRPGRERPSGAGREISELIERMDSVTLILEVPGYRSEELHTSIEGDEIEVRTPRFTLRKSLPWRVDPASMTSDYLNGVLSVRATKEI